MNFKERREREKDKIKKVPSEPDHRGLSPRGCETEDREPKFLFLKTFTMLFYINACCCVSHVKEKYMLENF